MGAKLRGYDEVLEFKCRTDYVVSADTKRGYTHGEKRNQNSIFRF